MNETENILDYNLAKITYEFKNREKLFDSLIIELSCFSHDYTFADTQISQKKLVDELRRRISVYTDLYCENTRSLDSYTRAARSGASKSHST